MVLFKMVSRAYQEVIVSKQRDIDFWILSTFLPTFILSRFLVHLRPDFFINIRGTHIHHLTWGIFILAAAGYLSLTTDSRKYKTYLAAVFGVGLALAFDEFGMWLRLQDNYWVRQSYDAILIIAVFLVNMVYFSNFWGRLLKYLTHLQEYFDD